MTASSQQFAHSTATSADTKLVSVLSIISPLKQFQLKTMDKFTIYNGDFRMNCCGLLHGCTKHPRTTPSIFSTFKTMETYLERMTALTNSGGIISMLASMSSSPR